MIKKLFCILLQASLSVAWTQAESLAAKATGLVVGLEVEARDTLNPAEEKNVDAAQCLAGLVWPQASFQVRCEATSDQGTWLMRFPSPLPSGDAVNDLVAMEWYVAKDEAKQPCMAPAVVVVHESGRGMVAGRAMCTGLRNNGIHAFLVHLPGYGARTSAFTENTKAMLPGLRQAISDVRRARDAVAALPFVNVGSIALQGTSLGGFVTASAAGLDHGFDRVFILLAGGDLAEVLLKGERDAAGIRKRLLAAGLTEADIRAQTMPVEPLRLAERLNPQRTWLFSGRDDEVVPPRCSEALANAAKLTGEHHLIMPAGHYSAAFLFPSVISQIINLMHDRPMMENVPPMPTIPPPVKKS